jgi:hypothetical protein
MSSANAAISADGGQNWRAIASMTRDAGGGVPIEMDSSYTEPSFLFSLENPLKYHVPVLLRVTADNLYGIRSYPYYRMINDNENWNFDELWFEVEKDYYDNYIRLLVTASTPVQQIPTLNYWEPNGRVQSAVTYPVDFNKFVASIPLNVKQTDALPLEISARNLNGKLFFQKEVLHLTAITPGLNKKMRSDDGLCQVEFAHNSLFKVMYVRILSETVESTDRYDIASAAYDIEPSDMPMKGGAWVKIKYRPDEPDPSKLGVYLQINGNNWRFLDSHREKNALEISGKVKSFGTYALIRDNEPPDIAYLYPINNSHLTSRLPNLKARFYDSLSGVSGEDNMVIRLDGTRLISEYDPEQRILFHQVKKPLSPGKHELTLYLKDLCGNESEATHTFWID